MTGDDVDLFKLPIPMSSIYDGGPMITAGVVIAQGPRIWPEQRHLPLHRQGKEPDRHRHRHAEQHAAVRRSAPTRRAGRCRFRSASARIRSRSWARAIARRSASTRWRSPAACAAQPVELAPCETIDLPYIADAEIVLEAEILPTGWTWPEGRFGEFTRLMGGLHWNPLVRIKAISMRKDAIYYSLHMPWENTWLAAPTRYAAIRQALKTAGVQVKDINVTLGGCAFWHAIISIKKQAGEGKNALLAALSVMDLKHVVVVDDDIDVFNPIDVEWAIATRVQGDRDVVDHPRRARASRSIRACRGRRAWCRRRQGRHRRHHPGGRAARALRAHRLCLRRHARRSPTTSRARADRRRQVAATSARSRSSRRNPRADRQDAALLHRNRRAVLARTISTPWRARWHLHATESCGRTRAGACACAARTSPPSRRGADGYS